MEALVILVAAAGLSAAVVWWAMSPPATTAQRPKRPTRRPAARPAPRTPTAAEESGDVFVLLPGETAVEDDRPPAALSVIRIVMAIAVVAAVVVATFAVIGFLLKLQLDGYFAGG